MKIAAFNVENLFDRANIFNEDSSDNSTDVIKNVAELNGLFEKPTYSRNDKARMLELFNQLEFNRYYEGPFALIRRIRGRIFKRSRDNKVEVVASGRESWIGWVELKTAPVNEVAVLNTGRVIRDVDADVLAVIEAENRVVLKQFQKFVFDQVKDEVQRTVHPYTQIMLIDGNDQRGIDVGLMTKEGYEIGPIRSHIHDLLPNNQPIFSRDCPEYGVTTPSGELVWVIPNHFKSKFGGNNPASIAKRKAQAKRTAEIYQQLLDQGQKNVIVLGDLNDTPESEPLKPLLRDTDLRDVSNHSTFDTGEFPGIGTYSLGNDNDKIDYLLLSPALFSRVKSAGLFRKGAWPGKRPKRWSVYPELRKKIHVASDHHVIWAEIDI